MSHDLCYQQSDLGSIDKSITVILGASPRTPLPKNCFPLFKLDSFWLWYCYLNALAILRIRPGQWAKLYIKGPFYSDLHFPRIFKTPIWYSLVSFYSTILKKSQKGDKISLLLFSVLFFIIVYNLQDNYYEDVTVINNKNVVIIHVGKLFSWEIFWHLPDRIIYGTISTAEPKLISRSKSC